MSKVLFPGQRNQQRIRSDSGLWTDIRIPSVGTRWDPSVGIRRNLSMGFDRPLLLISSFNKLVTGANFRGRSKPPIGSAEFRHQDPIGFQHQGSDYRIESPGLTSNKVIIKMCTPFHIFKEGTAKFSFFLTQI